MPINRLSDSESALVIIDLQEKFQPLVQNWTLLISRCIRLIRFYQLLDLPTLITEQYPKGLGYTVPEIRNTLGPKVPSPLVKTSFSSFGSEDLKAAFHAAGRRQWVLCGIETHVCVQQTAFDLLEAGHSVFIPTDAVSSRDLQDRHFGVERMRDAGAVISTTESLLFEAMKHSKHPRFREVSNLIKET